MQKGFAFCKSYSHTAASLILISDYFLSSVYVKQKDWCLYRTFSLILVASVDLGEFVSLLR